MPSILSPKETLRALARPRYGVSEHCNCRCLWWRVAQAVQIVIVLALIVAVTCLAIDTTFIAYGTFMRPATSEGPAVPHIPASQAP